MADYEFSVLSLETRMKYRKSLDELHDCQKYKRLNEITALLAEVAKENGVSYNLLLRILVKNMNYANNTDISKLGDKIIELSNDGGTNCQKLPLPVCCHLHIYNHMGQTGYQRSLRALKCSGYNILATYKRIL